MRHGHAAKHVFEIGRQITQRAADPGGIVTDTNQFDIGYMCGPGLIYSDKILINIV